MQPQLTVSQLTVSSMACLWRVEMSAVSGVRTFGALVVTIGCLALAPAIAHAGIGAGMVVTFPTTGTVGDTGLPASITLINFNSGDNVLTANTVCDADDPAPSCISPTPGILLTPSCATVYRGECLAADTGVFALSATGVGRAATDCAGMPFSITPLPGSTFGTVRFTPQPAGAQVVLPRSGSSCVIDFTMSVLKSATADQDPKTSGVQTAQATDHTQYSAGGLDARALGSSNGTTVLPPPPPPPPTPPSPPASPPASPPPSGDVLGAQPGSAKLSGKTGCQIKTFRADVKGKQIAKVVFTLDGKKVATLNKPNRAGGFSVLVAPGKLGLGRHRIRARVTFATSATSPQTLSLVFVRCSRGAVRPRFTG